MEIESPFFYVQGKPPKWKLVALHPILLNMKQAISVRDLGIQIWL